MNMNCFWYHVFLVMMGWIVVSCLPANNNNQANRQVQGATQGRSAPPPISLGRSTSPQQRPISQHAVSPSGPTRQSPRLAAQRQTQAQNAAGQHGQTNVHPGTSANTPSRGQIAEQRRLQRMEQRGFQAQPAAGLHGQSNVHPGTPANTPSRGQIAEQRRYQRMEQRGSSQVTDLQTQAPHTRQRSPINPASTGLREIPSPHHASQGHQTSHTPTQSGVTPTRQRSNPAHGLRQMGNTHPGQPARQAASQSGGSPSGEASGHKRAGSWVTVLNPTPERSRQRIQAGLKTPTKKH